MMIDRTSDRELIVADDAELQPVIAAEFLALADLLDSSSEPDWDTPSLCDGWRVREVIAHLTMAARYSEEEFMAELRECEFDFSRLSNKIATRDAELPAGDLVANLRADVMHHWTPPGGGYHGALSHVVIHRAGLRTRPSGSSSMTSPRAAGTHISASPLRDAAFTPQTSTGRTDPARRYGAGPKTSYS